MRPPRLVSSLAERMLQFLSYKHMQGYEYIVGGEQLERFDAFLFRTGCPGPVLRRDDLDGYRALLRRMHVGSQAKLLSTVRQFSIYLHAWEPDSAVLGPRVLPRRTRTIRFFALSRAQVSSLMEATVILRPRAGIRPVCLKFLIGLLYSTGLRVGEALALNLADVDLQNATLWVRRGKFHKERLVSISASTLEALRQWLDLRQAYDGGEPETPLLVDRWRHRLRASSAQRAFARLCAHCGVGGVPPPRLHDLRHNYACSCLAQWRQAQKDVNALLPVLANAMGHADFHGTQLYVHLDTTALQQAGAKFRNHFHTPEETSR